MCEAKKECAEWETFLKPSPWSFAEKEERKRERNLSRNSYAEATSNARHSQKLTVVSYISLSPDLFFGGKDWRSMRTKFKGKNFVASLTLSTALHKWMVNVESRNDKLTARNMARRTNMQPKSREKSSRYALASVSLHRHEHVALSRSLVGLYALPIIFCLLKFCFIVKDSFIRSTRSLLV